MAEFSTAGPVRFTTAALSVSYAEPARRVD